MGQPTARPLTFGHGAGVTATSGLLLSVHWRARRRIHAVALCRLSTNGQWGPLMLTTVTAPGRVRRALDGKSSKGIWDAAVQQLPFPCIGNPADPSRVRLLTWYLWKNTGGPQGVGSVTSTPAGSCTAFVAPGAAAPCTAQGW
jgi:hypothetical protein